MSTATLTAAKQVEHLDQYGPIHIIAVGQECVIVHDEVTHYAVQGTAAAPYRVHVRYGKAVSCTCTAARYHRVCKHRLAAECAASKW